MVDTPYIVTDRALIEKLQKLASEEDRVRAVDEQIAALSAEAQSKRQQLREEYRRTHSERFKDIDYRQALIGAQVEHHITIPGIVTYSVRPPTAQVNRDIDRFIAEPLHQGKNLGPVANYEAQLLAFVVAVELLGAGPGRKDLSKLPVAARLEALRGLPDQLLRRLADECSNLEMWLNIVLEIELGNF